MESKRFDDWARQRAHTLSRRQIAGVAGTAGLTAMIGRTAPASANSLIQTSQLTVQALTSAGPSTGVAYSGELEISFGDAGAIDTGALAFDGGPTVPVVGAWSGRALSLRATFPNGTALVLTGTGEHPVTQCSGALSGVFGGPELGDTGSWQIDPTANQSDDAAVSTSCSDMFCDQPLVLDSLSCQCVCPAPYEPCGLNCCTGGSVCVDQSSGQCVCPDGSELCGGSCVSLCGSGSVIDPNSCQCYQGCDVQCNVGQILDETTCTCGCAPGYTDCGSEIGCVDLSLDTANCGACGLGCLSGVNPAICVDGTCQCPDGALFGCPYWGCVDFNSDPQNCGACDNVCPETYECKDGACHMIV